MRIDESTNRRIDVQPIQGNNHSPRELRNSSFRRFVVSSILSFAIICVLMGCSSAQRTIASDGGTYTYRINPFPVSVHGGEQFAFPFLGGLNIPRPQFVDIDRDGDLDLFLQEDVNRVMFFENTGTPTAPEFTWRTFKYRGLDVGQWYRFNDLDFDGDFDLIAEEPFNFIRYYRNIGTSGQPNFVLAEDTLRDVDGEAIFSDRQNIPNVNDVDCDGLADLFIGRLDGTITRYEATSADPGEAPRFQLIAEEFEDIQIIGRYAQPGYQPPEFDLFNRGPSAPGPPSSSAKHGANTMAFADIDNDGDIDLLWGDYFEPGLLLLENIGSCGSPNFRTEPQRFPIGDPLETSGYNAPTVGDLDGDGDQDFLMGVIGGAFVPRLNAQANLYYYERTGAGYTLQTRRFLDGIDVGTESRPAAGDIDGDGDPDLLIGNKVDTGEGESADLVLYENEGSAADPAFALSDTLEILPAFNYAPALGDLDDDGDLDMAVGSWNKGIHFYLNDGTGAFEAAEALAFELPRGSNSAPALGDFDSDGDLDIVVGENDGSLSYYRNTGTPQAPAYTLAPEVLGDVAVERRSTPAAVDIDDDDDLDLIIGTEAGGFVVFRNEGTPQTPRFTRGGTLALPVPLPDLLAPAFVDVDRDGDIDLFAGTGRGGLMFFERN